MRCKQIMQVLERLSPLKYAQDWDNVGLLIGNPQKDIKRVMIALDASDDVITQCIKQNMDMLITHHPMIFTPMKKVTSDDFIGKKVMRLIENKICYYAMHTNFDVMGMAEMAANLLELQNQQILEITSVEKSSKVAVYVPDSHADRVREAMLKEGAGYVGMYSNCTFNSNGFGTFKALEGSQPHIGVVGELVKTPEVKIETIAPSDKLDLVITSMLRAHPYEEVAYDVYELQNANQYNGIGRFGYLSKEMKLSACVELVKQAFSLSHVIAVGDMDQRILKVGISTGAGKSMIRYARKAKVDLLITGDIDHHTAIDAKDQGLALIDAGHFGTEHIMVDYVKRYLQQYFLKDSDGFCELDFYTAREVSPLQIL